MGEAIFKGDISSGQVDLSSNCHLIHVYQADFFSRNAGVGNERIKLGPSLSCGLKVEFGNPKMR